MGMLKKRAREPDMHNPRRVCCVEELVAAGFPLPTAESLPEVRASRSRSKRESADWVAFPMSKQVPVTEYSPFRHHRRYRSA